MGGRRNGWKEEEWMEGRDLSANSTLRMRGEERPCPAVAAELSPRSKAVRMRLSPARVNQAAGTDLSEVSLNGDGWKEDG